MKQSKQQTSLTEKDALQDMLDAEKLLMSYYAAALTEGSSKSFRKEILKNYTAHAETQFSVFEQMLGRGYYEVQPAPKSALEEYSKGVKKVCRQLTAKA